MKLKVHTTAEKYEALIADNARHVISVVTGALSGRPELRIFEHSIRHDGWVSGDNIVL